MEDSELDIVLQSLNIKTGKSNPKPIFAKILAKLPNFFHWKSASVELTVNEQGIPVVTPKIEFEDVQPSNPSPDIISPDDALEILDRTLVDHKTEVWVTFDRLDEAFQGHIDIEISALRALLRTYLDLANLHNVKIKLFLRRDLFRRVTTSGFVNLTHINSMKIEIIWDEEDLLNLLAKRIKENSTFASILEISSSADVDVFDKIFPDQVDFGSRKPKTWVWIMRRIRDGNDVKPPRNLIDLINHARDAQLRKEDRSTRDYDGGVLIEPEALRKGLSVLSENRVNDTLIAESGILATEIEKFRGGKAEHNLDSLSVTLGISIDRVAAAIKPLRDLGFLEETGGTFKIPALYREGLEITQGKAFQEGYPDQEEDD